MPRSDPRTFLPPASNEANILDYLVDARSFLARAQATEDHQERNAHLAKVDELLRVAIEKRQLPWQEAEVLDIFKRWKAKPDQELPIESLQLWWGFREGYESLWFGLDSLAAKGIIAANATSTAYRLTDKGYAFSNGGDWGRSA